MSGSPCAWPSPVTHSGMGCRRCWSSRPIRAAIISSGTSARITCSAAVVSAYDVPTNDSTRSPRVARGSSRANGSRLRASITSNSPLTTASRSKGSADRNARRTPWISSWSRSLSRRGGQVRRAIGRRRCGWPRPGFFRATTEPYEKPEHRGDPCRPLFEPRAVRVRLTVAHHLSRSELRLGARLVRWFDPLNLHLLLSLCPHVLLHLPNSVDSSRFPESSPIPSRSALHPFHYSGTHATKVRRWVAPPGAAHAAFLGVRWLSTDVVETAQYSG